jgi:formylglycine-generating enzyme required for sulfatase activity
MTVLPAGTFVMGTTPSEIENLTKLYGNNYFKQEIPAHEVTILRPFAIGVSAITFEEWDACVAGKGCNGSTPDDKGWGHSKMPVINVSWEDANTIGVRLTIE